MNEDTRKFLHDTLFSLCVDDENLYSQVVSLNTILRMIINKNYPDNFKYENVQIEYAVKLLEYIEKVEKTNPHNYVPLVRGYIRSLLNM